MPLVTPPLSMRDISLIIRGLRAVEQQTVKHPDENAEVAALRRRLTELHSKYRGNGE